MKANAIGIEYFEDGYSVSGVGVDDGRRVRGFGIAPKGSLHGYKRTSILYNGKFYNLGEHTNILSGTGHDLSECIIRTQSGKGRVTLGGIYPTFERGSNTCIIDDKATFMKPAIKFEAYWVHYHADYFKAGTVTYYDESRSIGKVPELSATYLAGVAQMHETYAQAMVRKDELNWTACRPNARYKMVTQDYSGIEARLKATMTTPPLDINAVNEDLIKHSGLKDWVNCGTEPVQKAFNAADEVSPTLDLPDFTPPVQCIPGAAQQVIAKQQRLGRKLDPETKEVTIKLLAHVQKSYVETVLVPANFTDEQIQQVADLARDSIGIMDYGDVKDTFEKCPAIITKQGESK